MTSSAESEYLFRHALMRDVAYNLHMPSERAGLHVYAAQAWQAMAEAASPEDAENLATEVVFHGGLAAEADTGLAAEAAGIEFRWLPVAALYHKRQFDHAASRAAWKRRAEHALASAHERAEALVRLAEACTRAAEKVAAIEASAEAVALSRASAESILPEALTVHGSALLLEGDYAGARAALEEASGKAAQGSATHVMAARLLGQLCVSVSDDAWREATQHAIDLARNSGQADELAQARNVMAVALINFGDLKEAEACAREVVETAASEGNQWMEAVGLLNYSLACWQLRGVTAARPLLERCLQLAQQVGHVRLAIAARFQSAQFARAEGEYGLAYESLLALEGQAGEWGSIREQQAIPDLLVPVCNTLGRPAEALDVVARARRLGRARDFRAHEAEAALMLGDLDRAAALAESVLAHVAAEADSSQSPGQDRCMALAVQASVRAARGELGLALEGFEQAQQLAGENAHPIFVRNAAYHARALLQSNDRDQREPALTILRVARERMSRPDPWLLATGVRAATDASERSQWQRELHACVARMRGHEGPQLAAELRLCANRPAYR